MKSARIQHRVANESYGVIAAGQPGADDQVIKERVVGVGLQTSRDVGWHPLVTGISVIML